MTHDCHQPLTEHALGTLDPRDAARVDAHLATCAACRVEFDELVAAVAHVDIAAASGAAIEPSVNATADLLAAARRTPQLAEETPVARPARKRRKFRRPGLAWAQFGVATVAAICFAIYATVGAINDRDDRIASLERRLKDAKGDQVAVLRGASVTSLDTAGPFGDARAQVVLQKDAGVVAFRKVPAPPNGMVWQVWIVDADEHITSLGTIDSARKAAFLSIEEIDPDEIERFIVTAEPADGSSEEPSAEEVATGTV